MASAQAKRHEPARGLAPFAAAGAALFVLLMGSNLPTPLFPSYARAYALSPLALTLLFATYTLGVIPALLLFGPLSDAKGRRELLSGAIVVAALAAALFAAAHSVAVLFVAQAVQAVALGALQGTAAPTLVEHDPSNQRRRAAAIASALTVGGAAAGPLLAGVLAQYAPLPLRLCYLVEIALLLGALAGLSSMRAKRERLAWRPRRPAVPQRMRRAFALAATSAFVAWAVTGLFLSLIPSFITTVIGDRDLAVVGAVVALMLASSAVAQLAGFRLRSLVAQIGGLLAMLAGVAGLLAADIDRSLVALLAAAGAAGAGQGLAFMGSLGDVSELAPADRRAETVASFYVVVYLGTALPVIGVGALADSSGLLAAVRVFAYVVIGVCAAGLLALAAELRARVNGRSTGPGQDGDTARAGRNEGAAHDLHGGGEVEGRPRASGRSLTAAGRQAPARDRRLG